MVLKKEKSSYFRFLSGVAEGSRRVRRVPVLKRLNTWEGFAVARST